MEKLTPLIITSALLLLPLVPASILYLILTPKRSRTSGSQSNAKGELGAGVMQIAGFRVQFNVVGSTATYIILLAAATLIYMKLSNDAVEVAALADKQAWLVEVPVNLKDGNDQRLPANQGQLQLVQVELEPALTQASAHNVQFWVVSNNGRFPTARFSISNIGRQPAVLDLNDTTRLEHDHRGRRMLGIAPVWLELGEAYGQSP